MEKGNFQKNLQSEAATPPEVTIHETSLVLLGEDYSGRDEINLAGLPFALLQAEGRGKIKKETNSVIHLEWPHTTELGKQVTASWEVTGHSDLGLPGPSDEILFLVMMQLTRESADENGIWPQVVHFSAYDILHRCGWTNSSKFYKLLSESFIRFASIRIHARYSFFDARAKKLAPDMNFAILAASSIYSEKKGLKSDEHIPLSWFRWSDEIYASFLSGHVRNLALDFLISLENPTARRLFRLLEKFRYSRKPPLQEFSINLFKLRDRLGMTPYPYASKIREKLLPAINELKSSGYLQSVEFEKNRDKMEVANFHFTKFSPFLSQNEDEVGNVSRKSPEAQEKPLKRPKTLSLELEEPQDVRADAMKCFQVFQNLDEAERTELLELARQEVNPIWHDRVGQPESPMSLGLWQLVTQRYPEKLKSTQ